MSAIEAAERGRRLSESLMTSTCTVRMRADEDVMDPSTGIMTPGLGATVYSGRCRVRPTGNQAQVTTSGGGEIFTFDYVVALPFDENGSSAVSEGMLCLITNSIDPALIGVLTEVQKVDRGDYVTARRLSCNDVA